jgi:hypothetical protein
MQVKDWVAVVLGAIGTVLGVVNTWYAFYRKRVKLKVNPQSAFPGEAGMYVTSVEHTPFSTLCIEVINLSEFAVTINDVGFTLPERNRAHIPHPIILEKKKDWPRRLEPRESVTLYLNISDVPPLIGRAYAKTACGTTCFGDSRALKDYKSKSRGSALGMAAGRV